MMNSEVAASEKVSEGIVDIPRSFLYNIMQLPPNATDVSIHVDEEGYST